jgi:hypothetical protein
MKISKLEIRVTGFEKIYGAHIPFIFAHHVFWKFSSRLSRWSRQVPASSLKEPNSSLKDPNPPLRHLRQDTEKHRLFSRMKNRLVYKPRGRQRKEHLITSRKARMAKTL